MEHSGVTTAQFMDGHTARVRPVILHLNLAARMDDSVLLLREGDRVLERWALSDVREKPDQAKAGQLVLSCARAPQARVMVTDAQTVAAIRKAAPHLHRRDVPKGTFGRIFKWAGGAVASVLLIVFVIVPALSDQLAVMVPMESERKLGDASIGQISWVLGKMDDTELRFCERPEGVAALDKMVARLGAEFETSYDVSVRVLNHPMENAFAVPGGQVIVFDGLLQKADTPEEIAGVLGHELGHVVHRDPTRLALRSAGTVGILGMLLGDFTGGAFVLVLTERLIAASYAQDAETAADQFAYRVMGDAGLPTAPFGDFFERMAEVVGDSDGVMSHLASHPDLSLRAENARAADRFADGDFEPVLSQAEWAALRSVCETPEAD